jgi:hypothetical protein
VEKPARLVWLDRDWRVGHAGVVVRPARLERSARVEIGPAGILVVAMVGVWLSHNLEYLRVWGAHRFADEALSSIHLYMGPIGALLLVGGVVGVQSSVRLARRLESRLAELAGQGPGRAQTVGRAGSGQVGWSFAVSTLVAIVWLLQSGLYLAQENVEAWLGHAPVPGLGALTGAHALAPLVHLAVTLALVTVVCLLRRRVTALAAAVRATAAWMRACRPVAAAVAAPQSRSWTPVQRWGTQRWCRPPPVVVGS